MDSNKYTVSSGNVFTDVGDADAQRKHNRIILAVHIADIISNRGYTQAQAAQLLGIPQPEVSNLVNHKLDKFSFERLLGLLPKLDREVNIVVKKPSSGSQPGFNLQMV